MANRELKAAYPAEYKAYRNAKMRCNNPKSDSYSNYGARGVAFLFSSFAEFFADLGVRPSHAHSVDRIDTNGNYAPGNLRWATMSQQAFTRRKEVSASSLYKGVSWHKPSHKWQARIKIRGRLIYLGIFPDQNSASAAYETARISLKVA
jgi:hypothetical protein